MTLQEIKNKIWGEIPFINKRPYSNNIVGCYLRQIEKHYGQEEVVKLIKNSPLKNLGWGYIAKPDYKYEDHKYY